MDDAGAWRISSDRLASVVGINSVQYWRALYAVRQKIAFDDAIDGFSQDSVGDLVTVLETLGAPDAEEVLARAGLFFPHEQRVELVEVLVRLARDHAAAHQINREDFAGMLRHTGSVTKAISIYLDHYVKLDDLLRACVDSQCRGAVRGMAYAARRHANDLFQRHIVTKEVLLYALVQRLRVEAAFLGYKDAETEQTTSGRERRKTTRPQSRRSWALRVMGFDGGSVDKQELRSRYRHLIMRYHPDVNPAGLEICKDVTAAYSILLAGGEAEG